MKKKHRPLPMIPTRVFRIMAFLVLLALGGYGIVRVTMNSYTLVAVMNTDDVEAPWPANPRPIIVIYTLLLCFWVFAFVSVTFATVMKNRNCYLLACLGLMVCGVMALIFGTISVHARGQDLMEQAIIKRLRPEDVDKEEMFKWIIAVQNQHNCCGIVTHSDWSIIKPDAQKDLIPKHSVILSKSKDGLSHSCCSLITNADNTLRENCIKNFLYGGKELENALKKIKTGCGSHFIPKSQKILLSTGVEMLIAGFISLAVSAFLYCGATELFCLAPHYFSRHGSEGHSATSVYLADLENENDEDEEGSRDVSNEQTSGIVSSGKAHLKKYASRTHHVRLDAKGNLLETKKQKFAVPNTTSARGNKNKSFRKDSNNNNEPKTILDKNANQAPARNTRSDILQKLEMLFEGVDKNVSTLSTTPNPSGSLLFSSIGNNSPPLNKKNISQNKAPQLNQYLSVPQIHQHKGEWSHNPFVAKEFFRFHRIKHQEAVAEEEVLVPVEEANLPEEVEVTALNIPTETSPPPPVEVTNAINLINEDVSQFIEEEPVISLSLTEVTSAPSENSSLGFGISSSEGAVAVVAGLGEPDSSEDSSEDDDILLLNARTKSKARFPTLPTIVEEPDEALQKTGSQILFKERSQEIVGVFGGGGINDIK